VVSFTEDVADALGERSGAALTRLKALAAAPVVPLTDEDAVRRLSALCADLHEEHFLARGRLSARDAAGCSPLIAITVARWRRASRRTGQRHFGAGRCDGRGAAQAGGGEFRKGAPSRFLCEKLAMTADRLNDHVKRATASRRDISSPARADRGQALARVHQPVDPRNRLRPRVFRSVTFCALFPQTTGTTPHEFRCGAGAADAREHGPPEPNRRIVGWAKRRTRGS